MKSYKDKKNPYIGTIPPGEQWKMWYARLPAGYVPPDGTSRSMSLQAIQVIIDGFVEYHNKREYPSPILKKEALDKDIERFYWHERWLHEATIDSIAAPRAAPRLTEAKRWFVTINFSHDNWNVTKCCDIIMRVINASWLTEAQGVFELHRKDGQHPHCHISFTSKLSPDDDYKATVINRIWALKGIKNVVGGKNFIDCKPAHTGTDDYVVGDKQDSKKPLVELDRIWRESNNIPHVIS